MRQNSVTGSSPSERLVKTIRRATRKQYSAEEKIRIVLDGLRGESSIAELCRREGIAEGLYYSWSKEFLEAGKRHLAGDTDRAADRGEAAADVRVWWAQGGGVEGGGGGGGGGRGAAQKSMSGEGEDGQ